LSAVAAAAAAAAAAMTSVQKVKTLSNVRPIMMDIF